MAATATAITAVAAQPSALAQPVTTKSPMTFGAPASHIMTAITRYGDDPVDHGAPVQRLIGSTGAKFMMMPTIVATQITA